MTQITTLKELAKPWGRHVPSIDPSIDEGDVSSETDLPRLLTIARCVRDAFLNHTSMDVLPSIAHNCWIVAQQLSKPSKVLSALRMCSELLPRVETEEDKKHLNPFRLVIDGQVHVYDGYIKTLLATTSEYFRGLFFGSFKEGSSDSIILSDVSLANFQRMLRVLEHGSSAFTDMATDELLEFTCQARLWMMTSVYQKARKLLMETIEGMTLQHWDIAYTIYQRLGNTDDEIRTALSKYYERALYKFETSEELLKFLEKHTTKIPVVVMSSIPFLSDELVGKLFLLCSSLQTLKLFSPQITDKGFGGIDLLSELKELDLWISDETFSTLSKLTNLRKLFVTDKTGEIKEDSIRSLSQLMDLQALQLRYFQNLNGNVAAALSTLTTLRELEIDNSKSFGDEAALILFSQLTYLLRLKLRTCDKITRAGFAALTSLRNLQELYCNNRQFSDEDLTSISGLTHLRILDLTCCLGIKFRDVHLTSLQNLSHLRTLNLKGCNNLSNTVVFPKMSRLENLDLSLCQGLEAKDLAVILPSVSRLKRLNLSCCANLDDLALSTVGILKNLRELDLSNNEGLTDVGLIQLAPLSGLIKLSIHSCKQVTDAGLGFLVGRLGQLKELDVSCCWYLTDLSLMCISKLKMLQQLKLGFVKKLSDRGFASLADLSELQLLDLSSSGISNEVLLKLIPALSQLRILILNFCSRLTRETLAILLSLGLDSIKV